MSGSRFKIGDLAILAYPVQLTHLKGEEVEILEEERERQVIDTDSVILAYRVALTKTGEKYIVTDKQLKPLDDPNIPSHWSNCLWRPKETLK